MESKQDTLQFNSLADLINSIDLKDLKLNERQEKYVRTLPLNNWNKSETIREVYKKTVAMERYCTALEKKKNVAIALDIIRERVLAYNTYLSSWTFQESKEYSRQYIAICDREILRLRKLYREIIDKIENSMPLEPDERKQYDSFLYQTRKLLQTSSIYKENLDKMHGYLTERKEVRAEIVVKELKQLSDKELNELVEKLETQEASRQ